MGLFLALMILVAIGYKCWAELKRCPPEHRRKLLVKSVLFVLIAIIIALAITGRVSWIMGAIAALVPLAKIFLGLAWRGFPFIQAWMRSRQSKTSESVSAKVNTALTEAEAWEILGLEPGSSNQDIIQAHRVLMQKLHPDRGGNNYIATKLNLARDLLIEKKN